MAKRQATDDMQIVQFEPDSEPNGDDASAVEFVGDVDLVPEPIVDNAGLEWVDELPPQARTSNANKGRPRTDKRAAMDANPGKWLVWRRGTKQRAAQHLLKMGYELSSRRELDGTTTTYARKPVD
jgi:hypothetical protein